MTEHLSPNVRSEQILKAARKCFTQNGFFATKVLDIAEASGLSKGGIYFHFPSKMDIFRALVQDEYDHAITFLDAVVSSNQPIIHKFRELGEHFLELFSDLDNAKFLITIGEMALRDAEVAKLLTDLQNHYIARISELLRIAQEQGELLPIDTRATALLLKALVDGVQLNFALGLEIDAEKVIEAAIVMLSQGLLKSEEPE